MDPNEWGDWAAGTFAPVAFLWLVLGYRQQAIELKQNTEALRRQERQLEAQVRELERSGQLQLQLEATRLQAETAAQASRIASAATVSANQPAFVVNRATGSARVGAADIELRNSGRDASEVRVTIPKADSNGARVSPERIELWSADSSHKLKVRFPADHQQFR